MRIRFSPSAALVAVLVIGLTQAGGEDGAEPHAPTRRRPRSQDALDGAPPPLAALYERANTIEAPTSRRLRRAASRAPGASGRRERLGVVVRAVQARVPVLPAARRSSCGKEVAFLGVNVADDRERGRSSFLRVRRSRTRRSRTADSILREAARARAGCR